MTEATIERRRRTLAVAPWVRAPAARLIVYGGLGAIIGLAYFGAIVVSDTIFGRSERPAIGVAIATTAVVAVVFESLRRQLQRIADRSVYARFATPHEVLSEFSRRFSLNDRDLLAATTRALVAGTGAERVELWTRDTGTAEPAAAWPPDRIESPVEATELPVTHQGTELGELRLIVRPGRHLSHQDRHLAEQVASGIGLALRNRNLTNSLERRVNELRESQRRLVTVQDDTRRRLERDLHDGAQQQLVALRVKLGLARSIAGKEQAHKTVSALDRLATDTDSVIDVVRTFARGVHPPLLEAEGLEAAIAGEARQMSFPVELHLDGVGRLAPHIESTINLCVGEALRNVAAHAGAHHAVITIRRVDDAVEFEVRDDGVGFDPVALRDGCTLRGLMDRVEALDGSFSVQSASGAGTAVRGVLPIDDRASP